MTLSYSICFDSFRLYAIGELASHWKAKLILLWWGHSLMLCTEYTMSHTMQIYISLGCTISTLYSPLSSRPHREKKKKTSKYLSFGFCVKNSISSPSPLVYRFKCSISYVYSEYIYIVIYVYNYLSTLYTDICIW